LAPRPGTRLCQRNLPFGQWDQTFASDGLFNIPICMYSSYKRRSKSGNYPYIEVYQFFPANWFTPNLYQFTFADDSFHYYLKAAPVLALVVED
jgi:hypothetical protein